ncbi:hypothetical protein [Xylanibacter oryzae]|uniref:hypothetical protein n=1 Tax=Xylanibacter oryzae TaxID=185293 RepID=UPI0004B324CE|nr:hypothetical protein [Xylanibacter oryzae]
MITSVIGRKFLKAYNEKFNKQYDAKSFFVEVYYPLFFDCNKYMMTAGNSKLENPKITWDKMINGKISYETSERRHERFNSLIKQIDANIPDASVAVGYPSLDITATTSSQITNMNIVTSIDDLYLSWIGASLGVGVKGGLSIIFFDTKILLDIFEGWILYRRMLEATSKMKGNQITSWNSQWLLHKYDKNRFVEGNPLANFNNILETCKEKKYIGCVQIKMLEWTSLLIAISKSNYNINIMGYVYSFGTMNKTIGFIPFMLDQIRKPIDLYQKLFGFGKKDIEESLWGTAYAFSRSCQAGSIGLKAMEPKGLKDYIFDGEIPKNSNDEKIQINNNVYLTWIMAMLNNEQLWDKAQEFANYLQTYASIENRSKNEKVNKVMNVLETTSKCNFFKALTDIVSDIDNKNDIKDIAKIVNIMESDNVPYFLALVRFNYALIKK